MYPGTVVKVNGDGTLATMGDDPDGGEEEPAVSPKALRCPPIPYDSLKVGQKYTGTVRSIVDFGAFVDIGTEGDGLVHISSISAEWVNSVYDYLEEGQQIDVWVASLGGGGRLRSAAFDAVPMVAIG